MFKKGYLLNLVNIYSKFYGLLIFILSLFILNNKYLALIISILLVIATTKRRHLIIVSLISVLLSIINLLYPHLLWIIKICFLIIYLAFLSDIVDVASVKKLYEVSLYKYKNRFIMKAYLSFVYFLSTFKKNFIKLDKPRKEYGLVTRFGYTTRLVIKSYHVSKSELKNILLYHKLRFYNIEDRRESIDKIEVRKYDHYYIVVHIAVLLISLMMRFV